MKKNEQRPQKDIITPERFELLNEMESVSVGYLRAVHPYLKIQLLIMMSGCTIYALPCGGAVLLYTGGMLGSFLRNTVRLSGQPADWRIWLMALAAVSMMYLFIASVLLACRKSREPDSVGKLTLRYGYQSLTLIGGNALLYLVYWLLNGWILSKSF